jgi:hypothetical protein
MITFANPAWLYGLLGLVVPIGIHLLSRKEGKTIYIGSIRHLTDSDTAQFSSIRLNEILLLILRLLLIILLVFFLAGFTLTSKDSDITKWLIIEKGIEKNITYKRLIDSLTSKGFEPRWLAEGVPAFYDSNRTKIPANYYQFLSGVPAQADTAIVLSYTFVNNIKGKKISLPPSVKWLAVEPPEKTIAVNAIKLNEDSVIARLSTSGATSTAYAYSRYSNLQFEKITKIDSLQRTNPDTLNIAIYADRAFDYDRKIIQASLLAIDNSLPLKFDISVVHKQSEIPAKSDFIFWLANTTCEVESSAVIGYAECTSSNLQLIVPKQKSINHCSASESFDWIISRRLNQENALAGSLSYLLAQILTKGQLIYKDKNVLRSDQRSLPKEAAFSDQPQQNTSRTSEPIEANEQSILTLLFFVLIIERLIAFRKKQ